MIVFFNISMNRVIQFADFICSDVTCVALIRVSSPLGYLSAFSILAKSRRTSVIHGDCGRGRFNRGAASH